MKKLNLKGYKNVSYSDGAIVLDCLYNNLRCYKIAFSAIALIFVKNIRVRLCRAELHNPFVEQFLIRIGRF